MFPKDLSYISGNLKYWEFHFNHNGYGAKSTYHYIYCDEKNNLIKDNQDTFGKFYCLVEEYLWETFRKRIYRK